jgi:hypothetical protein
MDCVFHTDDGDPRVMLFVWYDKDEDPEQLIHTNEPSEYPGWFIEHKERNL